MIVLGCIAGIAALTWGIRTWLYSRVHETTDDAYVEGHLVPVLAKVGGYALRVNGVENQHVKEGDTLVVLDDADYRARLAQARADMAAAQAAVGMRGYTGQALAEVHTAEGQSAATDAQIAAAQANYDKAMSDLQRIDSWPINRSSLASNSTPQKRRPTARARASSPRRNRQPPPAQP